MKKSWWSLLLTVACSLTASAQSFQGTFLMHVQDDHTVSQMKVWVKGDHMLLEPIDPSLPPGIKILVSPNRADLYVLSAPQGRKTAVRYPFQQPAANLEPLLTENVTGRKKTVEGYTCKEVLLEDGQGQQLQLWVTDSMGLNMADFSECLARFSYVLNGGDYDAAKKFNGSSVYRESMALEVHDLKASDATHIWIKNIEARDLPDGDFRLIDYVVLDINSMPKGETGRE